MPEADAEDIAKAGEDFLLALCSASTSQSLDDFRSLRSGRRMPKSQQKQFFKWQAYNQCVQLHASFLSARTVKCSSGWKIDPTKLGVLTSAIVWG